MIIQSYHANSGNANLHTRAEHHHQKRPRITSSRSSVAYPSSSPSKALQGNNRNNTIRNIQHGRRLHFRKKRVRAAGAVFACSSRVFCSCTFFSRLFSASSFSRNFLAPASTTFFCFFRNLFASCKRREDTAPSDARTRENRRRIRENYTKITRKLYEKVHTSDEGFVWRTFELWRVLGKMLEI